MKPKLISVSVLIAAATAAGVLGANMARAATGGKSLPACPRTAMVQPFLPWLDPGHYFLGPSGSFENGLAGWSVTGGAQIVPGNESYYVHSAGDSHSLSLPAGSSVTTPPICVSLDSPDLRMFVRTTGSILSLLKVDMTYTNLLGNQATMTVGLLPGFSAWTPSLPVLFLEDAVPLVTGGGQTWVSFTFTPVGAGKWQIDDFYVDPIKHV